MTNKKKMLTEEQTELKLKLQQMQDEEERLADEKELLDNNIDRLEQEIEDEEVTLVDITRKLRVVDDEIQEAAQSFVDNDNVVDSILEFAGSKHVGGGMSMGNSAAMMEFTDSNGHSRKDAHQYVVEQQQSYMHHSSN